MGRWRPPQKRGSTYITSEGYQALEHELKTLWITRRDVTSALSAAAAEGDRSENAEYIYRKKQLREIDSRVRYLQKRIEELTIVDHLPSDKTSIFFGAWVKLEDKDGNELLYRIVGPDEFDIVKGYISMDSPVAKALMKKTLDEEVVVDLPNGDQQRYYIIDIQYTCQQSLGT